MTTRLRVSKIAIEIPKQDSDAWVHITVQQVLEEDGVIVNVIPRWRYISKPLSEIGMEQYPYSDVVLGIDGFMSGAGIASVLTSAAYTFIQGMFGGTIVDNGVVL